MKKLIWKFLAVLAVLAIYVTFYHSDWLVIPPFEHVHAMSNGPCAGYPDGICESCTIGQCTGKDATPPDPNRPYFDMWGNQFSYDGTLLHVAQCPYTDPISKQPNPYCEKGVPDNVSTGSDNSRFGK